MDTLFRAVRPTAYRNAFDFLAYTGARADEARGIQWTDASVDISRQGVWVIGKGSKRRFLALRGPMQPAWDALLRQVRDNPRPDQYVFPQGSTWFYHGMDRLTRKTFGQHAPDPKHPKKTIPNRHGHTHMLRHTFATMALRVWEPKWDITILAKWLGHETIGTAYAIYGHLIDETPPSCWGEESTKLAQTGTRDQTEHLTAITSGA